MPIRAYDPTDDMLKIKSMQQKFRDSFTGSSLDLTKWGNYVHGTQNLTVAGGNLVFSSGTTANASGYILSESFFTIPFRLSFGLALSSRIANAVLYIEAVSIDPTTLEPDGLHAAGFIFDGTSATGGKYYVQNNGATPLASGASVIPTTAGGVSMYEIEPFCDETWFHGKTMDSATARANSYCRHQQIPEPNALYKIRVRWVNGSSAPASNVSATIPFIACQDYAELTAEITAGRGQSAAGQGLGVSILNGLQVAGTASHDAAGTSVYPIKIGAQAQNVNLSAVSAAGDIVNLVATMSGIQVVRPYSIPETDWAYYGLITTAATTAAKAAGGAGIKNYVTAVQLINNGATATLIQIADGSTVKCQILLPANMITTTIINFPTPIAGTAATAMNLITSAAGNVYANVQGYQAP